MNLFILMMNALFLCFSSSNMLSSSSHKWDYNQVIKVWKFLCIETINVSKIKINILLE